MDMTKNQHTDGLSYKRMDLHVHTPASTDFIDKTVTPEQIVQTAIENGLEAIAITDHNSGEWIDSIVTAAKNTALVIFPGVEITCSGGRGGIHVIAIFDTGCKKEHVDYLLSNLGVKPEDRGRLDKVIDKSVLDVAKEIRKAGGLAVLAHANSTNGVLSEIQGQERIGIITSKLVDAVEATDTEDAAKQAQKKRTMDFLDGSNNDYKNTVLAVYQASDNPDADGDDRNGHGLYGIGKRSTYFKVDEISQEALRQCFTDPKVRLRLSDHQYEYPRITSIDIEGGYFDKKGATFHEGLNSILGGKGAGKSLLIELLRFGLNQASSVDTISIDHQTKLQKRLENYGRVTISLTTPNGIKRTLTRTFKPSENSPFETAEMSSQADNFPVLFLSQNEIINIAEKEKAQLAFIDQFFNFKHHQLVIADLEQQLSEHDAKLADCIRALKEVGEVKVLADSVSKDLIDLDKKLQAPIFDELKNQEAKKQYLERQREELESLAETAEGVLRLDLMSFSDIKQLSEEIQEDPLVKRLADIEKQAKGDIKTHITDIQQAIADGLKQIAAEQLSFQPHYTVAKEKYDEHVRQSGGDGKVLAEKRAQKAKELQDLRGRHQRLALKSGITKEVAEQRKVVLDKLKEAYDLYAKERQSKVKIIEKSSAGRLSLDINIADNKDEFTKRLTELKKGSYLKDFEIEQISSNIDPYTLINLVLYYVIRGDEDYIQQIADTVKLDPERVKILVEFLVNNFEHEELLELQYKAMPEDRPYIAYNVANDPQRTDFRPLSELSTGQKCTAMLIIALSDGNQPIVIDQPEDSLDIKSVWQDMCKKLRKGKETRQFIFTTHNSSLAVASDTDKYIIVEGGSSTGDFVMAGAMDQPSINDEVIKYLEGDLDAYNLKSEKYNIKRKLNRD